MCAVALPRSLSLFIEDQHACRIIVTTHPTLSIADDLDLKDDNSTEKLVDQISSITFEMIKNYNGEDTARLFWRNVLTEFRDLVESGA